VEEPVVTIPYVLDLWSNPTSVCVSPVMSTPVSPVPAHLSSPSSSSLQLQGEIIIGQEFGPNSLPSSLPSSLPESERINGSMRISSDRIILATSFGEQRFEEEFQETTSSSRVMKTPSPPSSPPPISETTANNSANLPPPEKITFSPALNGGVSGRRASGLSAALLEANTGYPFTEEQQQQQQKELLPQEQQNEVTRVERKGKEEKEQAKEEGYSFQHAHTAPSATAVDYYLSRPSSGGPFRLHRKGLVFPTTPPPPSCTSSKLTNTPPASTGSRSKSGKKVFSPQLLLSQSFDAEQNNNNKNNNKSNIRKSTALSRPLSMSTGTSVHSSNASTTGRSLKSSLFSYRSMHHPPKVVKTRSTEDEFQKTRDLNILLSESPITTLERKFSVNAMKDNNNNTKNSNNKQQPLSPTLCLPSSRLSPPSMNYNNNSTNSNPTMSKMSSISSKSHFDCGEDEDKEEQENCQEVNNNIKNSNNLNGSGKSEKKTEDSSCKQQNNNNHNHKSNNNNTDCEESFSCCSCSSDGGSVNVLEATCLLPPPIPETLLLLEMETHSKINNPKNIKKTCSIFPLMEFAVPSSTETAGGDGGLLLTAKPISSGPLIHSVTLHTQKRAKESSSLFHDDDIGSSGDDHGKNIQIIETNTENTSNNSCLHIPPLTSLLSTLILAGGGEVEDDPTRRKEIIEIPLKPVVQAVSSHNSSSNTSSEQQEQALLSSAVLQQQSSSKESTVATEMGTEEEEEDDEHDKREYEIICREIVDEFHENTENNNNNNINERSQQKNNKNSGGDGGDYGDSVNRVSSISSREDENLSNNIPFHPQPHHNHPVDESSINPKIFHEALTEKLVQIILHKETTEKDPKSGTVAKSTIGVPPTTLTASVDSPKTPGSCQKAVSLGNPRENAASDRHNLSLQNPNPPVNSSSNNGVVTQPIEDKSPSTSNNNRGVLPLIVSSFSRATSTASLNLLTATPSPMN
jgi:hypothetical protein